EKVQLLLYPIFVDRKILGKQSIDQTPRIVLDHYWDHHLIHIRYDFVQFVLRARSLRRPGGNSRRSQGRRFRWSPRIPIARGWLCGIGLAGWFFIRRRRLRLDRRGGARDGLWRPARGRRGRDLLRRSFVVWLCSRAERG